MSEKGEENDILYAEIPPKSALDTGGKSTPYNTPEVLRRSTNPALELALSGDFSWQE